MKKPFLVIFLIIFVYFMASSLMFNRDLGALLTGHSGKNRSGNIAYIYPNPSTHLKPPVLRLDTNENGIFIARIYDVTGTLMSETQLYEGQYEKPLDVSELESGTYFGTLTGTCFSGKQLAEEFTFSYER